MFEVLDVVVGVGDVLAFSLSQHFAPVVGDQDHVLELGIGVVWRDYCHTIIPQSKPSRALVVGHDRLDGEHIAWLHRVGFIGHIYVE